ncbi:MAG: aromatic amino acid hydroxylase [Halioglobus sp.]
MSAASQQHVIDSLPAHLRPFVALQDYSAYTPRDQATWRFLLHQLRENLGQTAHLVYLEGLARTGIDLEEIPHIEQMNRCLQDIGWRAVVVDGFIPPAIFMEFQAHRILVVAVDMRSAQHMLYTPAPDIVHESAGHAPFLVDVDYAEFLQRFGELGMRAVASKGDMDVYEAIRRLSIAKEAVDSTAQAIADAEQSLQDAFAANETPSETALLARLHWWTVEYGLVGDPDDYRIFGAGLLSSLGESMDCLDDTAVKKRRLTVDAINCPYDITQQQPQLFVTKSCRHLSQVLEEFGRQMCVNLGGAASLEKAIAALTVNTAVTNAGVEISGQFSRVIKDAVGNATYLQTAGPTQLAYQGEELAGHGTAQHAAGFGSPVGRIQAMERCLSSYTVDELQQNGIATEQLVCLEFLSGITVRGLLARIVRAQQKNLLLSFEQCTVTAPDGEVLFDPAWGVYDMTVGDAIVSVYGGSADQRTYPMYQAPSSQVTENVECDAATKVYFALYARVRTLRTAAPGSAAGEAALLVDLLRDIAAQAADEWLLLFEGVELAQQYGLAKSDYLTLVERLQRLSASSGTTAVNDQQGCLINYGLSRLGVQAATV